MNALLELKGSRGIIEAHISTVVEMLSTFDPMHQFPSAQEKTTFTS